MMARLLRWFERKAPWLKSESVDEDYAETMARYRRQAEVGKIRAEVQTENFLSNMFQERGPSHSRLPAKRQ